MTTVFGREIGEQNLCHQVNRLITTINDNVVETVEIESKPYNPYTAYGEPGRVRISFIVREKRR